jgi:hypothetical protein
MPLRAVHAFNIKVVEIGHLDTTGPSGNGTPTGYRAPVRANSVSRLTGSPEQLALSPQGQFWMMPDHTRFALHFKHKM